MSENGNRAQNGRSVPEEIAAEAGMPPGKPSSEALDKAHDTAGTAKSKASHAAAELQSRVSDTAEAARARAGEAARRARERVSDTYDDVRGWAADRYEEQSRRAAALADRGYGRLRQGRHATEDFVSENPLLVGVVGLAAGLMLGALLPRTRQEDRTIGPWADEVRDQGVRYARDATRRGRAFVESALDPDNLDTAVRRSAADDAANPHYEGPERTAHRL